MFGKVTNIADYGAFVEIEDGVEGLVHVSEMDWTNKNVNPAKVVHIGEEVEVMVLDVDEERRRISLGLKQCKPNPWEEFAENYNKGDKVSGQIKSITDFGIFIGLAGGIDGLVHLSDISWDVPGEEAVRNYKKGEQVEADGAGDRSGARAHLARHQAARARIRSRPYIADASEGHASSRASVKEVDAQGRDHRPRRRHRRLAARLRDRRAIASRTRARCSRSATRSKPSSPAWIARRRTISLSIKAKEMHEEAEAVQSYRSERRDRRARASATCSRSRSAAESSGSQRS